jgi:hypothetical protein
MFMPLVIDTVGSFSARFCDSLSRLSYVVYFKAVSQDDRVCMRSRRSATRSADVVTDQAHAFDAVDPGPRDRGSPPRPCPDSNRVE